MATIGGSFEPGYKAYVGIGQEDVYGTKKTATTFVEFTTEGFKRNVEEKIIEAINSSRNPRKRMLMNETVEGALEGYLDVAADGLCFIVKQAMGGTVTAATTVASCVKHTFAEGDMESNKGTSTATNTVGLTVQVRKGGTHQFSYVGCRVNTLMFKGNIGEPCAFSANFVGKTASTTADNLTPVYSDINPLNFNGVTISLTGTAEEFQSFELNLNNNLISDNNARALGTRVVSVLPPSGREVKLKLTQRFDTTTAYARFIGETPFAVTIKCDSGQTIAAGGSTTYSMLITLPKCYLNSVNPVVNGKGIMMQELDITPVESTSTSGMISIEINNATANYH